MRIPTKKVVNPNDENNGYMIVNEDDYKANVKSKENPDGYELHETDPAHEGYGDEQADVDEAAAEADAAPKPSNTDGTFDTPTPTDIRYPNKDGTEFARNHGAQIGTSAAELREVAGMPQKPGGIDPTQHEAVKEEEAATAKRLAAGEKKNTEVNGLKIQRRLPVNKRADDDERASKPKRTKAKTKDDADVNA